MDIAPRVERIDPSLTLQINSEVAAMEQAGEKVVRLGAGEPDFETPAPVKRAAIQAIEDGWTHYTATDGRPELKRAVCKKFQRDNALTFEPDQIMVTCGAKQALYDICQTLLRPGDEAVIPSPYWVSYPAMVKLAEAEPAFVETSMEENFTLDPARLAAAITKRTRLVILNSPNNPTGRVYSEDELGALGDVLMSHPQVYVISDDIYEQIRWDGGPLRNILNARPELAERCLVVNGVSKAYAMTGWRVGFVAGPKPLIKTMGKVQGQSTAGTASISQHAAEAALTGDQSVVREMVDEFKRRHDRVVAGLNELPGVTCLNSAGTFYAFPDFGEVIAQRRDIENDVALAEKLLHEAEVALVPGSAFGAPGHLRLSYTADLNAIEEGLARLRRFLANGAG